MAYVITAVGAGGKTSYLKKRAQEYLERGMRVAVTTTTHIYAESFSLSDQGDGGAVLDCFGRLEASGKLSSPEKNVYERICRSYDVVLVEGDGSHCMPMKIPGEHEPVIPENTDEIIVLMGAHAVGRRIDVVCQRYAGEGREHVTEEMLALTAERAYLLPLRKRYPKAHISYMLSRMPHFNTRITAVLMASGFGRRYGSNKLLDPVDGKKLYRHALDHIVGALGKENVVVVTQYDEIMREMDRAGICAAYNARAGEGIAASIRLGTGCALERGSDAVIFFAADMPHLVSEEISLFARQFSDSRKPYGCMVFGKEHTCTNPGAFRLETGAEKLLHLSGDRGAMRIMKQEPWNIYYYQIPPEYAYDVDTKG